MENLKNVAPIEDFNWDAYENGEAVTSASHEDLEKAYDGTLNKVNDREVVDGNSTSFRVRQFTHLLSGAFYNNCRRQFYPA